MIIETNRIVTARPAARGPVAARRAAAERLFEGGDTLIDDDTMRANWAVPWSDLMMTMFVLFAALLAAQTLHSRADQKNEKQARAALEIEREKIVSRDVPTPAVVADDLTGALPDAVPDPIPDGAIDPLTQINVLARSNDAVRESNLQNVEIALLEDQSVKVSVQGPMLFAAGKTDLRPDMTQFLDRLARIIKQTPYDVHIVGHTDDRAIRTGMFPSNWELSLIRASRVARHLIDAGGIEPSRFKVVGRGEYEPAHANTDEHSRALNRRVEIIITRDIGKSREAERR